MRDIIPLIEILDASKNLQAFIEMLRLGEGTQGDEGFRTMFGGGKFDSFADHPRVKVTRPFGKPKPSLIIGGSPQRETITSTAAGAGQFLERTWDGLVREYGFTDFSPKNQMLGIVALIAGRKALSDVVEGRFEQAVMKCNKEWASLPGSPYGQPVVTMAQAKAEYEKNGGCYETDSPAPAMLMSPPTQEKPMAPFIAAVLPSLISAIPELTKMFGSGSPSSERNAKAAEMVVSIAKDAIGARNEQELMETMASDPKAVESVRAAVKDQWFRLQEVGGGIQAAREAATKMQGEKGLFSNPAFIISLVLLVFPMMLLVDVFYIHPDNYSSDGLRTQIVTGVLMVISMIGGFWLGTSFSSSKKDDKMLAALG